MESIWQKTAELPTFPTLEKDIKTDVLIMMIGESSPTNLRSSTMSAEFLPVGAGVGLSYMISLPLAAVLGNQYMGIISICLLVPGFIAALITLAKKTADTKGIDLDTVTGLEWD